MKTPEWFKKESGFKSYFENGDGDAWCAVVRTRYHKEPPVIIFSGRDIEWEVHRIDNPDFKSLYVDLVKQDETNVVWKNFHGIVMGDDERAWIKSLLLVGGGRSAVQMMSGSYPTND